MHKIKIDNLTKVIKGVEILKNINLTLESGKIYGFVGRNGSGKTMLFRSLSGIMRPTSGSIYIDDKKLYYDIERVDKLGIIIENAGLYTEFTGFKNLKFLSNINKSIGDAEIKDAILRVGLDPEDRRPIKKYSLGMKQRIVIAQAIMEKPDFLFLDEPTNALDEEGCQLIHTIVKEEANRGALILLASHNKDDIELLCQDSYRMKEGMIVEGIE